MLKRMHQDIQELHENGYNVHVQEQNEDNHQVLFVRIKGPENTPYEGGYFNLRISLSQEYPRKSCSVGFRTQILHPNVQAPSGSICLSVLNKQWKPQYTLLHVVKFFVPLLLANPQFDDPLNRDAAHLHRANPDLYYATVRDWITKFATLPHVRPLEAESGLPPPSTVPTLPLLAVPRAISANGAVRETPIGPRNANSAERRATADGAAATTTSFEHLPIEIRPPPLERQRQVNVTGSMPSLSERESQNFDSLLVDRMILHSTTSTMHPTVTEQKVASFYLHGGRHAPSPTRPLPPLPPPPPPPPPSLLRPTLLSFSPAPDETMPEPQQSQQRHQPRRCSQCERELRSLYARRCNVCRLRTRRLRRRARSRAGRQRRRRHESNSGRRYQDRRESPSGTTDEENLQRFFIPPARSRGTFDQLVVSVRRGSSSSDDSDSSTDTSSSL